MVANFLHTKFTFVYIYIIFMLHFVKNEDGVKMTIACENSKVDAYLYTTNEVGKKFYELLKEKKTMELPFQPYIYPIIGVEYNDEKNFRLIDDYNSLQSFEYLQAYHIYADNEYLCITIDRANENYKILEIGKMISTNDSITKFKNLINQLVESENNPIFNLVFALEENNIDLLLLISFIIIIILLIVCLLSFLTK